VAQTLQNFDLSNGSYGEPHLVLVLEMLHLLQGIQSVVVEVSCLIDRSVCTTAEFLLIEDFIAGVDERTLPFFNFHHFGSLAGLLVLHGKDNNCKMNCFRLSIKSLLQCSLAFWGPIFEDLLLLICKAFGVSLKNRID
jgi:hypothetical protein